jgi:hypothetical protein
MNRHRIFLLIANLLTFLAFLAHTIGGDMELHFIIPDPAAAGWEEQQQMWTMARCGWHWISYDLLLVTVALSLINFTSYFSDARPILRLITLYFVGYAIVWLVVIIISPDFAGNFLKLGQWLLLAVIALLTFLGQRAFSSFRVTHP